MVGCGAFKALYAATVVSALRSTNLDEVRTETCHKVPCSLQEYLEIGHRIDIIIDLTFIPHGEEMLVQYLRYVYSRKMKVRERCQK